MEDGGFAKRKFDLKRTSFFVNSSWMHHLPIGEWGDFKPTQGLSQPRISCLQRFAFCAMIMMSRRGRGDRPSITMTSDFHRELHNKVSEGVAKEDCFNLKEILKHTWYQCTIK